MGGQKNKEKLLPLICLIDSMGYKIFATEHTAEFIKDNTQAKVQEVYKISEPSRRPNISELLYNRNIDFIINIPSTSTMEKYVGMLFDEYQIRRKAVERGIPVLTTIEAAMSFVQSLEWRKTNKPTINSLALRIQLIDHRISFKLDISPRIEPSIPTIKLLSTALFIIHLRIKGDDIFFSRFSFLHMRYIC